MFVHLEFNHLIMNMILLLDFWMIVEQFMGSKRFFCYYLLCWLWAALAESLIIFGGVYLEQMNLQPGLLIWDFVQGLFSQTFWGMLGASWAVFGILLAFAWLLPEEKLLLFLFIPIKAKYWLKVLIAIECFFLLFPKISSSLFSYIVDGKVGHGAHLGGMILGFLLLKFYYKQQAIQLKK